MFILNNIKYSFISLFIVSCSSNKIYRDIDNTVSSFNKKHDYKIQLERDWNPTKVIFQELKDSLTQPTNIIYMFIWDTRTYQPEASRCLALVSDRNSGKKFYIKGSDKFSLDYNAKSEDFFEQDFLLENYLLGKTDYLHSLAEGWFDGYMFDRYVLVEIKSDIKNINTFKPLTFDKDRHPLKIEDVEKDLP